MSPPLTFRAKQHLDAARALSSQQLSFLLCVRTDIASAALGKLCTQGFAHRVHKPGGRGYVFHATRS